MAEIKYKSTMSAGRQTVRLRGRQGSDRNWEHKRGNSLLFYKDFLRSGGANSLLSRGESWQHYFLDLPPSALTKFNEVNSLLQWRPKLLTPSSTLLCPAGVSPLGPDHLKISTACLTPGRPMHPLVHRAY